MAYDAFDRLIEKRVDLDDSFAEFSDRWYFVYDDPAAQGGLSDVVLVYSGFAGLPPSLETRYLSGPAIDQVFADEDFLEGLVLWTLADQQGTVRDAVTYDELEDATTVAIHRTYGVFGEITSETHPGGFTEAGLRPAYTGRWWDEDAGLIYYRARWYDPAIGRFASEDPIGFAAGDTNLQRNVGNNPTNSVDPSGLVDASSPFPGSGWNPLNWPFEATYSASKLYFDIRYDNFGRTAETRWKEAELDVRLQSRDRVSDDEMRRAVRERNQKPIPECYNELIQGAAASVAGGYGGRPGGLGGGGRRPPHRSTGGGSGSKPPSRPGKPNPGPKSPGPKKPTPPKGKWEKVNEHMSDRARDYQEQITGRRGEAYIVDGVRFDGINDGVLIDAKGPGYGNFFTGGDFAKWWKGKNQKLQQANNQLGVANGAPVRWHVAEQDVANFIRRWLTSEDLGAIEVVHTPPTQ